MYDQKPRSAASSPDGLEFIKTPREEEDQKVDRQAPKGYCEAGNRRSRRELKQPENEQRHRGRCELEKNETLLLDSNCPTVTREYKFVTYLGSGSYGDVFQAISSRTKQHVAIKRVRNIFNNINDAKRLLRELRILRTLRDHPAIINLQDIIPPSNILKFRDLSIVLEFADTDLRKCILSDQHFTTRHVQHLMHQLLLGLKYIHSANIVHRDIKPANILVNGDCSLKICDFGLARCIAENLDEPAPQSQNYLLSSLDDKKGDRSSRKKLKKKPKEITGHVVTRWYRAPEVILLQLERHWAAAIDMWAVGCILGELLEMIKSNCPDFCNRKPLFPGTSSWPYSWEDPSAWKQNSDQLNVIFDKIGTPNRREIQLMKKKEVQDYLKRLEKRPAINWQAKFPGAGPKVLNLLRGLLRFNYRKRLTVEQSLADSFLRDVRHKEYELRCKPGKFEFEDIPICLSTLEALIIDEIIIWNPSVAKKIKSEKAVSMTKRKKDYSYRRQKHRI